MATTNKFCPKCSHYSGEDWISYYKKYGDGGCSGIPFSSDEYPEDECPFCFSDEPLLTPEEKRQQKIEAIYKVIRNKTPKKAAEYIVDHIK